MLLKALTLTESATLCRETMVPVDFSIFAGGDEGPYTYNHLLVVSLHSDGHTEIELPRYYSPPAFGQSLDIQDWDVLITDQTTEVWVRS